MKEIKKIVLTGGPCAGKTTAFSKINEEITKNGYKVLFLQETATELINSGFNANTCKNLLEFQTMIAKLQLYKEQLFLEFAKNMPYDKILVVCDRGVPDNKAFLGQKDYNKLLKILNKTEIQVRDNYDAVFHLCSCAKGAEKYYSLNNNSARTETLEQARESDDKIISAYTGHPHLRIIDNSTNFEDKMKRLIEEIRVLLGVPKPYEIERKYLIEMPDIKQLENNPNCKKVEVVQTYLKSKNNEEVRIRQRGEGESFIFTKTIKKRISHLKRIEIEEKITKDEYLSLLLFADTKKNQIHKTRYCLIYLNQYFEIDIYPFWDKTAIMEIELNDENQEIKFPQFIKIIKEVTDELEYSNSHLAKK